MHSYFVAKGGGVLHMVLDYCEGGDLLDAWYNRPSRMREATTRAAAVAVALFRDESDSNGPFLSGVDGSKRLQESVAQIYLVDVLSGLRFLHSHGIAHRDDTSVSSGSPTGSGFRCEEMVGKNYYMAPEIVMRERYDPRRADIWSAGIAFFILLTSSPPFERADPSDPGFRYVAKRGIKAVFTAWGLGQEVSEPMQDLLARMLCVDPEERITMEEIWQHPVLQRPRWLTQFYRDWDHSSLSSSPLQMTATSVSMTGAAAMELVEVTKKTRGEWLAQAVRLEKKSFSKSDSLGQRLVEEAMKSHNTLILALAHRTPPFTPTSSFGATVALKLVLEADTANLGAIALYESQGFMRTTVRTDYYKPGRDALLLELKL
ncbi:Calcium/calmodulin-dependent/calcium-dependent protein kinase [Phytophthora cactorum]|nr:Calcium/calmodulin-dependent/calcium-dependent protein kinase [Phytophthora cactorum]